MIQLCIDNSNENSVEYIHRLHTSIRLRELGKANDSNENLVINSNENLVVEHIDDLVV